MEAALKLLKESKQCYEDWIESSMENSNIKPPQKYILNDVIAKKALMLTVRNTALGPLVPLVSPEHVPANTGSR